MRLARSLAALVLGITTVVVVATRVEAAEPVQPDVVAYLNRLSDVLWIVGRKLEHDAGVSGSLRDVTGKGGNRFSRAW